MPSFKFKAALIKSDLRRLFSYWSAVRLWASSRSTYGGVATTTFRWHHGADVGFTCGATVTGSTASCVR